MKKIQEMFQKRKITKKKIKISMGFIILISNIITKIKYDNN